MSADYIFWKYRQGISHEDERVYTSLCDGEQLDELQTLPIEEIRKRIQAVFRLELAGSGQLRKRGLW